MGYLGFSVTQTSTKSLIAEAIFRKGHYIQWRRAMRQATLPLEHLAFHEHDQTWVSEWVVEKQTEKYDDWDEKLRYQLLQLYNGRQEVPLFTEKRSWTLVPNIWSRSWQQDFFSSFFISSLQVVCGHHIPTSPPKISYTPWLHNNISVALVAILCI